VRGRWPGDGHDRGAAVLGRFRHRPAPDAGAAGGDEPAGEPVATGGPKAQPAPGAPEEPAPAQEAPSGDPAPGGSPFRIGIVLFDGVEELDWAGPWEVLATWARYFPDDGVRVCTLAPSDAPVTCAKGARVVADHTWDDHPPLDVLIYPGGEGTRRQLGDMALRRWLLSEAAQVSLVASVCTGALVLADAGLLDGRPATTHWSTLDQLAGLGAGIEVRADKRVVDDGDVVTAAGVSAGIDMALHLVARFAGEQRARQVRKTIEYFPEPAVQRPPSPGEDTV
jgi:transcriptional regulator GlxA family with amidase domain